MQDEGEGVLVGVQETTPHGGVEWDALKRSVLFGVAANDGVEGEDGGERDGVEDREGIGERN